MELDLSLSLLSILFLNSKSDFKKNPEKWPIKNKTPFLLLKAWFLLLVMLPALVLFLMDHKGLSEGNLHGN